MAPPTYNFLKSEVKRLTAELAAAQIINQRQSDTIVALNSQIDGWTIASPVLTSDTPPFDPDEWVASASRKPPEFPPGAYVKDGKVHMDFAIPTESYRHAASAGELDGHDPSDPEPDFDCRLGYVDLVTRQPADIEAWRSRRDARIKERTNPTA